MLSGAVTVAQLESHIDGAGVELKADTLDGLDGASEDPVVYWTARSQRPWT